MDNTTSAVPEEYRQMVVIDLSYEAMENYLSNPSTRIKDSRILEMFSEFRELFQVLGSDNIIRQTGTLENNITLLDLFKQQYRHNHRNNPGLYGLLDEPKAPKE